MRTYASFEADRSRQSVTIRDTTRCLFWAALVVVGGVAFLVLGASFVIATGLAFAYALQALIAETLGVRVSANHISVPRRLRHLTPFIILWRWGGSLTGIESLTCVSQKNKQTVMLRRLSGAKTFVLFSNCDEKLRFFEIISHLRPGISIYRSR